MCPKEDVRVSEIQFVPIKPNNGLIGFASFVYNGQLYVGSVAVYTRPLQETVRLVYPQKTLPNGKIIQCVHPINKEVGKSIELAITQKYQELMPNEYA